MSIRPTKKTRILLVDDHPVVRKGLAYVLQQESDFVVCGECEDSAGVLPMLEKTKPHVVVLDLFLKDANGIDLLKDIKKLYPETLVLVLSMQDERLYAERVLRAGGVGYVSKEEMLEKIVSAIRSVLQGHVYMGDSLKDGLLKKMSGRATATGDADLQRLSDREIEVFHLLGQGYSTRRIAERWRRSVKTVETYRAHIKRKLHLTTSAELLHLAVEWSHRKKEASGNP